MQPTPIDWDKRLGLVKLRVCTYHVIPDLPYSKSQKPQGKKEKEVSCSNLIHWCTSPASRKKNGWSTKFPLTNFKAAIQAYATGVILQLGLRSKGSCFYFICASLFFLLFNRFGELLFQKKASMKWIIFWLTDMQEEKDLMSIEQKIHDWDDIYTQLNLC